MNIQKLDKAISFIDSWLDFQYKNQELPGLVAAISHKGKIVFNKAYGYANLENKEKLKTSHLFRIASQSKTFTATAIMQLAEQKKLSISDPIFKYLPWLSEHKDKRFQAITIEQLLSHGAGIIRDGLDADFWEVKKPFPDREKFKKEILKADLIININTKLKYSNFGYGLLGLIIENITGMSYADFVKKNIIKPLGLTNTGPEFTKNIEQRLSTGYSRKNKNNNRLPVANIDTHALAPATGFYSTSEDLCKYYYAHFIGNGQLLSDESKKNMQTARWQAKNDEEKSKYGLGLALHQSKNGLIFGHLGMFPGHFTSTICDPKNELIVVLLTNCIGSISIATLLSTIKYFDKHYSLKSQLDLRKFEGRYMNLWQTFDLVSLGKNILNISPEESYPFKFAEKLEYINPSTLKIVKANSFFSEGELVHFSFDSKGKVDSIIYAGETSLPEKKYILEQEKLQRIG